MRFGKAVKNLITGLYVLNVLLVMPVTLFIPALALAQVTDINLHVINSACVCVCVIYTMLVRYGIREEFEVYSILFISSKGWNQGSGLDRRSSSECYGGIDNSKCSHGN